MYQVSLNFARDLIEENPMGVEAEFQVKDGLCRIYFDGTLAAVLEHSTSVNDGAVITIQDLQHTISLLNYYVQKNSSANKMVAIPSPLVRR